jgi:hypothetical protein
MLRMCLVLQYSAVFVKYNTSLTKFVLFACLFIYLPDDDLVEVETCRRVISDKLLFITDCAVFLLNIYNRSIAWTMDYLKFTSLYLLHSYIQFFQVLTSFRLCDSDAACPVHLILLNLFTLMVVNSTTMKLLIMQSCLFICHSLSLPLTTCHSLSCRSHIPQSAFVLSAEAANITQERKGIANWYVDKWRLL